MEGRFKTLAELKEFFEDYGCDDVVFPETDEEASKVIGTDSDGQLVYAGNDVPEFKSYEELVDYLCNSEYESVPLFSDDYYTAVIGITDGGRLIYDYYKMAEFLVERDGMDYEGAMEWIDYNAIRTLPYMGPNHPIIRFEFPDV